MFDWLKRLRAPRQDADYQQRVAELLRQAPIPFLWLFGKTQSGKTTIIKYLTGAEDAEIGAGFRPCTRFSREYSFPTADAPLLTFLDTRGLEEPGYDPNEDIAQFHAKAHVMIVTVRLLDFGVDRLLESLRLIRKSQPTRPVLVVPTCLHEAYPQQQHVQPYPFLLGPMGDAEAGAPLPENLRRSVDRQRQQFGDLCDYLVPIDLTPPEEGFDDSHYGGARLKQVVIEALPAAYRQTLVNLEEATRTLHDYYERRALPRILGYSSLAATAGAIPIPWVDLFILPGIQTRMIFDLARLYGQPLTGQRFMELAGTLGMGMLVRQGIRELTKFIPIIGSLAGATLAGSATFALGKAFCYYYSAVHKGHVPKAEELKQYYREELARAERLWMNR